MSSSPSATDRFQEGLLRKLLEGSNSWKVECVVIGCRVAMGVWIAAARMGSWKCFL